ncbi:unnamed protein product [Adineta ricciae]|uniref:Uncharacterized protein n=1 Tax=Adineta ricciae TaxID=249248 RepID=A0A813UL15_ADIRI|nr:unnamed protein product [Adineta ricciae]
MLHYHTDVPVACKDTMPTEQQQRQTKHQHREHSLSPDSLDRRFSKQQQQLISDDVVDEDESFLSSSPSLASDSISIDQPQVHQRQFNTTKSIRKTLTYHGLLNSQSFFSNTIHNDNDNDDLDDDLDEIHLDQDDVNLLFSDPDDGLLCRLSSDIIDVDDDYDDDNDDFCRHIRPISMAMPSDFLLSSSLPFQEQQQYFPYHLLDPISEAASEDERRAAISNVRQPQKHKHSTSSSLSMSANGNYDDDTTTNDDLSTLSDIDEQGTSSLQSIALSNDQHIHKKRRHTENCSIHWSNREARK